MSTNIKLGLKNGSEAVYGYLNRKIVFHLVVHNSDSHLIPQIRVELNGPPEVRILSRVRGYGGIESRRQKIKPFVILPKSEGIFSLTATLTSNNIKLLTIPVEVRVGNNQGSSKPIIHQEQVLQIECPFCGELVESDAKECLLCGSSVKEQDEDQNDSKNCQICGQILAPNAKFCVKCGTKTD